MQIQRLNMDNSWFIHFDGLKILVDPWLTGVEVDYFPWFNTAWHRTKPIAFSDVPEFDLVLITQKYPDHYHPETLRRLDPKRLIVPSSILEEVKTTFPDSDVRAFQKEIKGLIGTSVNLHFLPTRRKMDPIYDAIVLENGSESILIASHGFALGESWHETLQTLPPIKLSFTPFNLYQLPFFLGGTVSPGLEAVKNLIRKLNPQKLVATHDEDKHAKGIVQLFAKITFSPTYEVLIKDELFKDRLLKIDDYRLQTI